MADEDRVFRYRANLDDEQNSAYLTASWLKWSPTSGSQEFI